MTDKLDSGKMYICELCKKSFKQKCDYDSHKNTKRPCISLVKCEELLSKKYEKMNLKNELTKSFNTCLDILRDNEGLTGEKALRNLSYLLILKLLESHFDGIIDIDNYPYDYSCFQEDVIEHNQERLLTCVRFSKLAKEKEADIPNMMRYLWEIILSVHPSTKNIFLQEKRFDIQRQATYKKLINKLNEIDLSNVENDVLGDSYEDVIKDIMVGKVFGQFFTPLLAKKFMVRLINPQINDDGTIESCCDPTMGTGGFLIEYIRVIQEKAKLKNISLDWDFIKTEGLYGKELEPDTYQLAVSNMLISTGHMFEQLDRGDSIREPITRKFDNILANPPFGIKGLKYDDFNSPLKLEYVPIKSENAVSLFIQAIIYMLKIGGKCAVVLPDGQDLFSKTNKTLVAVREYIMKTCDLKEIIYLPSGIFAYTLIKTCVFYFVKKREGSDVIEVKINVSKTQKETGRDYKFSKTHQTTKVAFYDYNPYEGEGVKNLLVEVPIEKIVSNSYSLNYAEYMKDDTEEEQYEDGVVVKTLDQIFHITKGTLQSSKNIEGQYTFITASDTHKTHNSFTHDCECVMLVSGAEGSLAKAQYFKGKFIASDLLYVLISKNSNEIYYKYAWYYLNFNREKHLLDDTICCGTPKKMISKDRCSNIKIPIPSIERQQEIVKYLDFIYEKANKTSIEKIAELKQLNEFCLNNQMIFGENVVKKLSEISIINPENMKSGQYTEINYIDIASVKGGQILELQKLTNDFPSRAKRIVKKGDILYSSVRPNLKGYVYISDDIQNCIASTGFADIRVKESNKILSKYLYYIMTGDYITDELISKAKGAQYPAVSFDDFETLKIPIPSLERQQEIIEYCEANDALIQKLEMEIENNKKQAQQFIDGIVKSKSILLEECESHSSSATESSQSEDEDEIVVAPKSNSKAKSCRLIKSL
jgi:type I restriction enzyme M protein